MAHFTHVVDCTLPGKCALFWHLIVTYLAYLSFTQYWNVTEKKIVFYAEISLYNSEW